MSVWVNRFDAETVQTVERAMAKARRTVPIFIQSPGGDVYSLFAMVDIIDGARVPVATIAVGQACSSAAVLLACGANGMRYVAPHTEVMIHEVSADIDYGPAPDIAVEADVVSDTNRRFLALLDKRTGKRAGYWQRAIRKSSSRDLYLSPTQAVRAGLADHIGVPFEDRETVVTLRAR